MAGVPAGVDVSDIIGGAMLKTLETAEEKVDEEIRKLERLDEDDIEAIRRKRIAQLKKVQEQKAAWKAKGHGEYREIVDQKNFFEEVKKSERVVVHFYRPTTLRCTIVDKHLGKLAPKHIETKFVKVNAEKSPFLTERLNIYMLPTIVLIKGGKTDHSIIGFDEMGGGDDFPTEALEVLLLAHELVLEKYCRD